MVRYIDRLSSYRVTHYLHVNVVYGALSECLLDTAPARGEGRHWLNWVLGMCCPQGLVFQSLPEKGCFLFIPDTELSDHNTLYLTPTF